MPSVTNMLSAHLWYTSWVRCYINGDKLIDLCQRWYASVHQQLILTPYPTIVCFWKLWSLPGVVCACVGFEGCPSYRRGIPQSCFQNENLVCRQQGLFKEGLPAWWERVCGRSWGLLGHGSNCVFPPGSRTLGNRVRWPFWRLGKHAVR